MSAAYDFDQNYDAINGSSVGSTGGSYTAQGGETLSAVAQNLWGDASLWYLLADANGMSGTTELMAGQTITIPNKVINRHNNSDTFRPYDPNEALGDTSPTDAAKPPKPKMGKCGQFGQILQQIVTLAVTIAVSFTPLAPVAPIIGNLYGQAFGLATGIQTGGFNWKSFGMAVVTTAVSFGVGQVVGQGAIAGSQFAGDVVRGALTSAVSQGIGVATHLQDQFDWAGVAAAGISAGVGGAVSRGIGGLPAAHGTPSFGTQLVSGLAGAVAGAATRSIADGSDFGDNLLAALPDVIVQTVGRAIGNRIAAGHHQHDESGEAARTAQPAASSGAEDAPVASLSRPMAVDLSYDTGPITRLPVIDLDQALGRISVQNGIANMERLGNVTNAQTSARSNDAKSGDIVITAKRWTKNDEDAYRSKAYRYPIQPLITYSSAVVDVKDGKVSGTGVRVNVEIRRSATGQLGSIDSLTNEKLSREYFDLTTGKSLGIFVPRPGTITLSDKTTITTAEIPVAASPTTSPSADDSGWSFTDVMMNQAQMEANVGAAQGQAIRDAFTWAGSPSGAKANVQAEMIMAGGDPYGAGALSIAAANARAPEIAGMTRDISKGEMYIGTPLTVAGVVVPELRLLAPETRGAGPLARAAEGVGAAASEVKSFSSFSALKRYLGSPGEGNQWHHIVEQTPGNVKAFGAKAIQSTDNIVAIPSSVHIGKGSISAYYSSTQFFTGGKTVRAWLSTQPLAAQRQFGLQTLKDFGR